jgi:hypothetical protein
MDPRTHGDGRGPPVSDIEGEREEVGVGEYQWALDVGVLVFPSRETVSLVGRGQQGRGEGGARTDVSGWPKKHDTLV